VDEAAYITCDGSTCVMWTLLHVTLTAVAARGLSGRTLLGDESLAADGSADDLVGINEAMDFVKSFVGAFLSCGPCKTQFLQDFDNCEYGRCSVTEFRSLPLWLWRAHNAVSVRVAARHGADTDRRWPMYEDCPTCWREAVVVGGSMPERRLSARWSSAELDAPFHTARVFWHMVRTYIGVQRVAFELSDLSREEQDEVRAVLDRERAIASGRPLPHHRGGGSDSPPSGPPSGPHEVASGTASEPRSRIALVGLASLVTGIGVALWLVCGCDPIAIAQFWAGLDRTSRAPPLRQPAESGGGGAGQEEDDLVEEGAEAAGHEEDPAAE